MAAHYHQNWCTPSEVHTPPYVQYNFTEGTDGAGVAFVPYWSGFINDKRRHFDENERIRPQNLNYLMSLVVTDTILDLLELKSLIHTDSQ